MFVKNGHSKSFLENKLDSQVLKHEKIKIKEI